MRQDFDLEPGLLYFNSANQSIAPRAVRDAIARHQREYERNPSRGLAEAWGKLWAVQSRLARSLGADPGDLFLRQNVTAVLNTYLLGVPLPVGSEILAGELEYGAIVNICRLRARRDGLGLRLLKMPATETALRRLSPEELVDQIVSQLAPQTKLLLLSHVVGGIGLELPIAAIAKETRRRGVFLVVDGAYAPGAIPVSLRELEDVDFYGCSLYKWMLGPKGTAFGWVARRHHERMQPISAGWTTYESFGPFSAFGGGSRFQEAFLMSGCHDFAPFFAIDDTLAYWEARGAEAIRARMRELGDGLEKAIGDHLGWRRLTTEKRGPIATFRLPSAIAGASFGRWAVGQRIELHTFEVRGSWHAALSPHVYNTEDEIRELVDRLGKYPAG